MACKSVARTDFNTGLTLDRQTNWELCRDRLASVSRRELMTGVLQDGVPHLVAPLPAGGIVAISAEVDFGVCEVVRWEGLPRPYLCNTGMISHKPVQPQHEPKVFTMP